MKRVALTYTERSLRFAAPVTTARGVFSNRDSVIIALHDSADHVAVAEAAPWPEFGTETLAELRSALFDVSRQIALCSLPENVSEIPRWLRQLGMSPYIQPALCFALECAALSLLAARAGVTLAGLLAEHAPSSIRVNALITALDTDAALSQLSDAQAAGYKTVKIKVGAQAVEADILRVTELLRAAPGLQFRLDANGAWSFGEACTFFERVRGEQFEYIEDPLRHTHPLSVKKLREQFGVNLALDHSERDDLWRETRIKGKQYSRVIVKPQIFGWMTRIQQVAGVARECGAQTIVSSCMESSLGLSYVAHAAAVFGEREAAHGLGTAALFGEDVLSEPLQVRNGEYELPAVTELPQLLRAEIRRALAID